MSLDQIEPWGIEVPAQGAVEAPCSEDGSVMEITHVTHCALGEAPKDGPHVVKVVVENRGDGTPKPVVLGTLLKGSSYQFPVDLAFCQPTKFLNTGKSAIYLTGYRTTSFMEDDDSQDEYETDEEEDEEEDEDEEPPNAIPMTVANGKPSTIKQGGRVIPVQKGLAVAEESSEEEDEDEDEEDESEEEGDFDERLGGKTFEGMSSGSEDEDEQEEGEDSEDGVPASLDSDDIIGEFSDEDESEEEEDVAAAAKQQQQRQKGSLRPQQMDVDGASEEEEESDEDEDEDEDESEEEESDEPQPAPVKAKGTPAAAAAAGGKRPPAAQTPQPQPSKKQKAAAAAPASAPPKVQGGGAEVKAYIADLVGVLRQEGGTLPLSALGSKRKKPDSIKDKFKAFITAHPEAFAFDNSTQKVSLAK